MKKIVFVRGEFPHRSHTLTAVLNMDADLVFEDGEFYSSSEHDNEHEVDHYLTVYSKYKHRVLESLSRLFDGISETCGEVEDERLMWALARVASSNHWQSLGEIEDWLTAHGIPFTAQKRVDFK